MKEKIKKRYWAGFENNRIAETCEYYGDRNKILAIYLRKSVAQKLYEDVRLVEIKIISQ